jgi:uncharacterized protein (DUF2252 family)
VNTIDRLFDLLERFVRSQELAAEAQARIAESGEALNPHIIAGWGASRRSAEASATANELALPGDRFRALVSELERRYHGDELEEHVRNQTELARLRIVQELHYARVDEKARERKEAAAKGTP